MLTPELLDSILKGIVDLNLGWYPYTIILPLLFGIVAFILVGYGYKHPSKRFNQIMTVFIAVLYFFAGYSIVIDGIAPGNNFLWVGALGMWLVMLLFLMDLYFQKNEFLSAKQKDLKIWSILFMVTGVVLYPLIEIATGFTWPRMVFFGAECPTTIFTIGLLIGSLPKVNKVIYFLLVINAMITGTTFAWVGATFDYAYGFAGLVGLILAIKYFWIKKATV